MVGRTVCSSADRHDNSAEGSRGTDDRRLVGVLDVAPRVILSNVVLMPSIRGGEASGLEIRRTQSRNRPDEMLQVEITLDRRPLLPTVR